MKCTKTQHMLHKFKLCACFVSIIEEILLSERKRYAHANSEKMLIAGARWRP